MAMNQEVKAKWVAKLKDPAIKQVPGCLKKGDGFCCLGVLTELYIEAHPEQGNWEDNSGNITYITYKDMDDVLHPDVMAWAGLDRSIGGSITIDPEDIPGTFFNTDKETPLEINLTEANDSGVTFPVIAKYIEEQL